MAEQHHASAARRAAWSGTGPSSVALLVQRPGYEPVPVDLECGWPVFILTMALSGSALLRFILDSHPVLACPSETAIGHARLSLLRVWHVLNSDPGGRLGPEDFRTRRRWRSWRGSARRWITCTAAIWARPANVAGAPNHWTTRDD
jgi:hypothetical protein